MKTFKLARPPIRKMRVSENQTAKLAVNDLFQHLTNRPPISLDRRWNTNHGFRQFHVGHGCGCDQHQYFSWFFVQLLDQFRKQPLHISTQGPTAC